MLKLDNKNLQTVIITWDNLLMVNLVVMVNLLQKFINMKGIFLKINLMELEYILIINQKLYIKEHLLMD